MEKREREREKENRRREEKYSDALNPSIRRTSLSSRKFRLRDLGGPIAAKIPDQNTAA